MSNKTINEIAILKDDLLRDKKIPDLSNNYILFPGITLQDYLDNPIYTSIECVEGINKLTLAISKNSFEAAVKKGLLVKKEAYIDKYTKLVDPNLVLKGRRSLKDYSNSFIDDVAGVVIKYTKSHGYGRFYATGSKSLQNMEKKLRSFLLLKTVTNLETLGLDWVKDPVGNPCFCYKDYDLKNSMPTMLLNFIQVNGFYEQKNLSDRQSVLKKIVSNRELLYEEVSKQTGLDISVCKQTILAIIYGAKLSEHHKKSPLLVDLDIEMEDIFKFICQGNNGDILSTFYKNHEPEKYVSRRGQCLSFVYFALESVLMFYLLVTLENTLRGDKKLVTNIKNQPIDIFAVDNFKTEIILMHDGFLIPERYIACIGDENMLHFLNKIVNDFTQFSTPLVFVEKTIECNVKDIFNGLHHTANAIGQVVSGGNTAQIVAVLDYISDKFFRNTEGFHFKKTDGSWKTIFNLKDPYAKTAFKTLLRSSFIHFENKNDESILIHKNALELSRMAVACSEHEIPERKSEINLFTPKKGCLLANNGVIYNIENEIVVKQLSQLPELHFKSKLNVDAIKLEYMLKYKNSELEQGSFLIKERLTQIFGLSQIDYILMCLCAILEGKMSKKLILIYSSHRNSGKSVFVHFLAEVFGSYYGTFNLSELKTNKRSSGDIAKDNFWMYPFCHTLICVAGENASPENHLSGGLIKVLQGGDRIAMRKNYTDPWDCVLNAIPIIASNNLLLIEDEEVLETIITFIAISKLTDNESEIDHSKNVYKKVNNFKISDGISDFPEKALFLIMGYSKKVYNFSVCPPEVFKARNDMKLLNPIETFIKHYDYEITGNEKDLIRMEDLKKDLSEHFIESKEVNLRLKQLKSLGDLKISRKRIEGTLNAVSTMSGIRKIKKKPE